jgi:hypothetical protein
MSVKITELGNNHQMATREATQGEIAALAMIAASRAARLSTR